MASLFSGPPKSLAIAEVSIERARAIETSGMARRFGGPEKKEAIQAFIEKREPDFKQFRK